MKCTEVTEWMHRYLDHDLSPEETVEMYRHIDNCPSCAEVFDRLTMLSEQLEQLPDIKPPFSLVDSILPQLERIDSGVKSSSAEAPEEGKVIPMTRKNMHGKAAKGTSRAASMATRTGIGAVAAAIILLFAVFKMPDSLPSADVEMSLNQAADTASSSEPLSKMATENADTAATGDEAGGASLYQMEIQATESADAADGGRQIPLLRLRLTRYRQQRQVRLLLRIKLLQPSGTLRLLAARKRQRLLQGLMPEGKWQ